MKMRLESLVHAARQRYGAWAVILILFAALCTLSVFSARDAREAAADPAKAESDSSVYYSPNDAASQETDRESAANSANFKEYETFFTVRAYNGSVAVFKDGNDVPLYCIETPLSSLTEEDRRLLARGILCRRFVSQLYAAWQKSPLSRGKVRRFLAQYDIRSKYAMRAYQKWGNGAIDLLAANPYLLCVPGVELDFLKADAVAQGMQFAQNAPQRVQAGIIYILQYNTNNGNSCLPLDRLRPKACAYLKVNEADFEIAYAGALDEHTLCVYEKNGRDSVSYTHLTLPTTSRV